MAGGSWQILAAVVLDALIGDPPAWPHPVKGIGRLAQRCEALCRRFGDGVLAGAITVVLVLGGTIVVVAGGLAAARALHPVAGIALSVYLLYSAVALRDLVRHAMRVHEALAVGDLETARQRVAMIVGRDTKSLDAEGVIRAAVESVAENIVDGITAPLFYAALGGPVAAIGYKAVNTMDSLFGYRNARYERFGKVAARLDDAANFLPARLTGLLLVAAAVLFGLDGRRAWRIFRRDRLAHKSPNAGHPEAAVAGALGVRLGGPAVYFGRLVDKPAIGDDHRPPVPGDIVAACRLAGLTTVFVSALVWLLAWWK